MSAFDAHLVRSWVRLAEGDLAAALADAEEALELGRSFGGPQLLYPGLAAAAGARLAAGRRDAAGAAATELLAEWATTRHTTLPSFWAAELAGVLASLGRGGEFVAAVDGAPETRWVEAGLALAVGDHARAREVYEQIGAVPQVAADGAGPTSLP